MSHHQTSPASHFTRNVICSRVQPHGCVTHSDGRLILTVHARRYERPLSGRTKLAHVLLDRFGIELDSLEAVERLLGKG